MESFGDKKINDVFYYILCCTETESKEMRQEYKHSLIKRLAIKSQMMPD